MPRSGSAALPSLVLLLVTHLVAGVVSAGGLLLVANKSDDTVDLIDLATSASVATLPTGHAPHEIAVSPDVRVAVVSNYGDRETPGSSLTVIDLANRKVLRSIDLGEHTRPHGLAFVGSDAVAVTTEGSRHLLVVDLYGKIRLARETGADISHMVAVAPDGSRAFVANIGSGSVTVVDLNEEAEVTQVVTGDGAEGIAVSPDGTEVWVTNRAADTVTILDTRTLEKKAEFDCPGFPIRIAFTPDGVRALISAAKSGEVVAFDTASREEVLRRELDLTTVAEADQRLFGDRFGDSPVPVGLQISADGSTGWVAATQADFVVVVDPATLEVRGLLRAGREPDGMALAE